MKNFDKDIVFDKDSAINNYDNSSKNEGISFSNLEERRNIRIVFMGTPSFAVPVLEGLFSTYHVVMVVCQPDRKKNRKGNIVYPETKKFAINHKIDVFQPTSIKTQYQEILNKKPDVIITCAYGQIIPDEVIHFPKFGCINVHGSLLPMLRGGAPIHWAIIQGLKETGITIMSMSSQMDAGDIIRQASIPIKDDDILDTLYEKMSYLGRDLLLETLPSILDGTCTYQKQDEKLVTFGFNITKNDEKIDFSKTGIEIQNLVRGLNSTPGAYCYLDKKRMKVYEVELVCDNKKIVGKIGEIVAVDKDGFICRCQDGYLKVKDIAIEGKKRCKVHDYFNGINSNSLIGKVIQ